MCWNVPPALALPLKLSMTLCYCRCVQGVTYSLCACAWWLLNADAMIGNVAWWCYCNCQMLTLNQIEFSALALYNCRDDLATSWRSRDYAHNLWGPILVAYQDNFVPLCWTRPWQSFTCGRLFRLMVHLYCMHMDETAREMMWIHKLFKNHKKNANGMWHVSYWNTFQ